MGRVSEKILHGIPIRPFSDTQDGRIVAEQFRSRKDAEQYHGRSLRLQQQAVDALSQLHGGHSSINKEDFLRSQGQTQQILYGLAGGLREMHQEQISATDAVNTLNQISANGFNALHNDISNVDEGVKNVEKAVQDGTREVHGPRYTRLSASEYADNPKGLFELLSAYTKGVLSEKAREDVKSLIDKRLGSTTLANKIEKFLVNKIEQTGLKSDIKDNQSWDVKMAATLIENPGSLIDGAGVKDLQTLASNAAKYKHPELQDFVKNAKGLLLLLNKARNTPLSKNTLVSCSNDGLLDDHQQHYVKKRYRTARETGSNVDRNYNMLEMLDQGDTAIKQRDVTNYQLQNIGSSIAETNEQVNDNLNELKDQGDTAIKQRDIEIYQLGNIVNYLADTNERLVNLEELVNKFTNVVQVGFSSVSKGLEQVSTEIGFSRVCIITELQHLEQTIVNVGSGIQRELAYGNKLLEDLVWLNKHSNANEARQFFEDGLSCLKNAETVGDVKDAYKAFVDGTNRLRSSAENQYGAGLAAELMGDFKEAIERYGMSARRADDDQRELTSWSFENIARIQFHENNLPDAVQSVQKAVKANNKNLSAHFAKARYLAFIGRSDEALKTLEDLILKDELYLLRFRLDSAFALFKPDEIHGLYIRTWENRAFHSPDLLHYLQTEFLALDDSNSALTMFQQIADFAPNTLLKNQIWRHPLFDKIKEPAKEYYSLILDQDNYKTITQPRYAKALLLYHIGLAPDKLLKAFAFELGQDPDSYNDDKAIAKTKIIAKLEEIGEPFVKQFLDKLRPVAPAALQRWIFS